MKIKPGVSVHGINPAFHFVWPILQATYHQYNNIKQCVITSGTEYLDPEKYPDRAEDSLHYQGRAIDIRTRGFTDKQAKDMEQILRERFPEEFTISYHGDHFHIEYHPLETTVLSVPCPHPREEYKDKVAPYIPVQARKATKESKDTNRTDRDDSEQSS